jgi:hypothetical protein
MMKNTAVHALVNERICLPSPHHRCSNDYGEVWLDEQSCGLQLTTIPAA